MFVNGSVLNEQSLAIVFSDWLISKNLLLCNRLAKWTETWWEAPMEGSVLSFLKAEWKVSDTGSDHWAWDDTETTGSHYTFDVCHLPQTVIFSGIQHHLDGVMISMRNRSKKDCRFNIHWNNSPKVDRHVAWHTILTSNQPFFFLLLLIAT
jgi:hypothetical protein